MTDYLHEKTALLPKIAIRDPRGVVGKNTEQAMLIGAVHGYCGLIRGLIGELKRELGTRNLPVVTDSNLRQPLCLLEEGIHHSRLRLLVLHEKRSKSIFFNGRGKAEV